jgi:DNA-binding GntR family transcriptional regulator
MTEPAEHPGFSGRNPGTGATEHVVTALAQAIRDAAYSAGDRLVETRLTEQLGVSRSSVREALHRLEKQGLVEIEPHRGAIVRRMGRAEIIEILGVREVLEGLAAALAARNVDENGNRQRLEAVLTQLRDVQAGHIEVHYLEDNLAFHQLIVEISNNGTLAQQIRQLQLPVSRHDFFDEMGPADWARSLTEHEFVVEAILDGDPALAEQQMRAHIRRTIRLVKRSATL